MMNFETFLVGLMVVSTLTSLVTEAIKNILKEHNKTYHANTLAGIVSAVLSIGVGVGFVFFTEASFTAQMIICIIALVFMSWLCAMVGYDKVVGQFKNLKGGGNDE